MDWDRYHMGMAEHAARKSKDATQVGAALVGLEREVRLTAYNGPPRRVHDTAERRERPTKYLFASHAEANLIAFAAREGIRTAGCTVFCTHAPCAACARTLIQAGVCEVVYGPGTFQGMADQWVAAEAMFREASVGMRALPAEDPYQRSVAIRSERDIRQDRMEDWVNACFGPEAMQPYERAERVLEEALELAQAEGVTTERIARMVNAVYAKPPGTPGQEIGGVSTCLLAYGQSRGISVDAAELHELLRITALPPEHSQARHAAKFASGLALQPTGEQAGQLAGEQA